MCEISNEGQYPNKNVIYNEIAVSFKVDRKISRKGTGTVRLHHKIANPDLL